MVSIEYEGKILKIDGREIQLRHPIQSLVKKDNLIVVLLKAPSGTNDETNILAFDETAQLVWEIDPPGTTQECQPYVEMRETDSQIIVFNWNGYSYDLDLEDGSVEPRRFSR